MVFIPYNFKVCQKCGGPVEKHHKYCKACNSMRWKECDSYQKWLKQVNDQADIKRREFIEAGDFGDLEYMGGFTTGNCEILLRCKKCGAEQKRTIDGVRSAIHGHNATLRCRKCNPKWLRKNAMRAELRRMQREIRDRLKKEEAEQKEKEKMEHLRTVKCAICGKEFSTFQPFQKTCSKECSKRYKNHKVDHRIPKSAIVDSDITLATLFKRDKGVCYICGCLCNWNDIERAGDCVITGMKYPSIDHVIPVSRGGKHAWNNVRLACRECNTKKTDTDPVEFLGTDDYVPENAEVLKRIETRHLKKTIEQCTPDGDVIAVYESTAEAERQTGFKQKQIQNCARGECKTYRGFVWKYA